MEGSGGLSLLCFHTSNRFPLFIEQMPDIENVLKTRIQSDRTHTFVVIVPTDSARLHRQRELIDYHRNRAVANLQVCTITDFVQRLYSRAHPSKRSISSGLQNLWMHEITDPQSDNGDAYPYKSFRPNEDGSVPDSTLSLIVDTINRLRERGETTQSIKDTINCFREHSEFIVDSPTTPDLIQIYENYEARLEDRWIDEQGKRFYLANNFNSQFMRNAFRRVNLVVVEGFTVLSKADIKILTHIARIPQIEMWFRTDWLEGNENLYKNITDLVSQFRNANASMDPDYERDTDQHQHFAENLFHAGVMPANPNHNSDDASQITVLKPADRSEEVEEIARRIQKHVSKKHCNLNDICVAYYNIGLYRHRIAEIFPAYGIPYSLAEGTPLTKSEVVKSIFSRLSLDRTPLNDTYFSEVEPASDTRLFHPSEFQEYVEDLLKRGKVIQHILNPMFGRSPEVVEAEIEAYRQFNKIVKELCSVLRSEGIGSDSFSNYIKKLHHIAKHTNYRNRVITKGETVRIVQLGELRSQEFDTVFLGDFVDGSFPENYRPDPLLPEVPYRTEEEQLHDNRFMFYRVLKSFRNRLYLLVPKREREADLIPSPFLEQLKAVTKVKEVEEIEDTIQGSTSGFLSTYGNYVWTTNTPANGIFPDELEHMRSLIKHVVKVEKSREETHNLLNYEGVLTVDSLSTKSRERLRRRRQWTYSITDMETYAKCPFQYFAAEVLKLDSKDEEEIEGLSPLETGELAHNILAKFYDRRREQPAINQCDEAGFETAKQQLFDVIDDVLGDPTSEDLFREVDKTLLRVRLNQWLAVERQYDVTTAPRYFEVSVGRRKGITDSVLSHVKPICIGDVPLNAKIDRIDMGEGVFNVIDYKTGSVTPGIKDILEGRALQLPIYLEIARQLLGDGYKSAAGLYHKVRLNDCKIQLGIGRESARGETYVLSRRTQQMLSDEEFDKVITRVSSYLTQYVNGMSDGNFPLITRVKTFSPPEEDGVVETAEYGFIDKEEYGNKPVTPRDKTKPCSYCTYKRVCRVGAVSEDSRSDD